MAVSRCRPFHCAEGSGPLPADLGFVKGGFTNVNVRKWLGKLVRGIPYLLRTKTAVEKRKRELEKFFAKIKRGSFSSINLCKKQEGIVF